MNIGSNTQSSNVNLKLHLASILIIIAVIFIILLAKNDPTTIVKNTYMYIIFIVFLIIFSLYFLSKQTANSGIFYLAFFICLLIAIMFATIYFMITYKLLYFVTYDMILYALLLCIVLLGLAMFYMLVLSKYFVRGTWPSFIINFIFFIPCLFSDILTYLLKDFITTPKSVFHLLFIEFIFIISYFYFYPKSEETSKNIDIVLVTNPIMLNINRRIDKPLFNRIGDITKCSNSVTSDSPIRNRYAIGMWIFLNVQPSTQLSYASELQIFYYGSNDNNHPKVTYDLAIDKYNFYLAPNTVYSKSLPHQKWNYFVFNYTSNEVDIFINGVLEQHLDITDHLITYTASDNITIGQSDIERSGIYGAICNIVYYRDILSKGEIIQNYNLFSIKTPPI